MLRSCVLLERDLREEEDDADRVLDVDINHRFNPLKLMPLGEVPPNPALPTLDMKTLSGASLSEVSLPPGIRKSEI